ncbi:multidrug efflux pump subunit AcrA (membrane-fusion protein) [Desulfitispora alkaliphila]|uniref:hypothetical protein n=1 Tax=Desulfitispora alkaliphila TaxID=622674 RepID=UPI003D1B0838
MENSDLQAQVKQAQAALQMAEAQLAEAQSGARPQEIEQTKSVVRQTELKYNTALDNYERMNNLMKKELFLCNSMKLAN